MSFFELTTFFFAEKFENLEFSIFAGPDKNFLIISRNSLDLYLTENIHFEVRLCDSYLQEGPKVGSRFQSTQIFLSTIDSLEHWMLIGQKHLPGTLSVWPTCDQKNGLFRADDQFF